MEIREISRRRGVWVTVASEFYQIQIQRKALEKQEEDLKKRLLELSDNRPSTGGGLLFTVSFRKGSVDYKAIPQLRGLDLEPFRGPEVASWKIQKLEGR